MSKVMNELAKEIERVEAELEVLRNDLVASDANDVNGQIFTSQQITIRTAELTVLQRFQERMRKAGHE